MTGHGESDALHRRVQRYMASSLDGAPGESFDALACDVARFQAARVAPIASLMRARGIDASKLGLALDIAAVPTDAFRMRRIAAHPEQDDARVFATSGTTGGIGARGRHPIRNLASYVQGACAWGGAMLWPDGSRLGLIALAASETDAHDSSLSFMLARFAETLGGEASFHLVDERLDVGGIVRACDRAAVAGEATLVAGTAFAFVHLEDALGARRLPLPTGSRAMPTGGFKGRSRVVEEGALFGAIAERFALPPRHVVAEYGMTELSSQMYQRALVDDGDRRYRAPPWLRVTAVDPVSLEPVPAGVEGLGRFVDLANVDSSVAVQTADVVRVDDDGSVTVLGRTPGATPRGCSLALEHLLAGHST